MKRANVEVYARNPRRDWHEWAWRGELVPGVKVEIEDGLLSFDGGRTWRGESGRDWLLGDRAVFSDVGRAGSPRQKQRVGRQPRLIWRGGIIEVVH